MVVYRLEHPQTGEGPYGRAADTAARIKLAAALIATHGNDWRTHPGPFDDELSGFVRKHNAYFGCVDTASLYAWFDGFWPELMECGFKMEAYKVKTYQVGKSGTQVAFDMKTAKKL